MWVQHFGTSLSFCLSLTPHNFCAALHVPFLEFAQVPFPIQALLIPIPQGFTYCYASLTFPLIAFKLREFIFVLIPHTSHFLHSFLTDYSPPALRDTWIEQSIQQGRRGKTPKRYERRFLVGQASQSL